MQSKKMSILETFVTLILDNINNIILVSIATFIFRIDMKATLILWFIGQSLNLLTSYSRRRLFVRYGSG